MAPYFDGKFYLNYKVSKNSDIRYWMVTKIIKLFVTFELNNS